MTKACFTFSSFKPYARFILENEAILEKMASQYLQEARESAVPLLKQLAHLSQQELEAIARHSVQNFLEQALQDTALADVFSLIEQWKAGNFMNIPRENIEINDLVKLYSIRKKICIFSIDRFTQDISTFQSIVNELEEFYSLVQEHAFTTYVEIHHEALYEEKEFISSIINNSIDGILAFDKELRITALNSKMEEWHGLKRADVLGQPIYSVFPVYKDSQPGFRLSDVLTGQSMHLSERPFKHREGYYEANILPLINRKGETTGGFLMVHETTQRKEAELLIYKQNKELSAALEENRTAREELKEVNEVLEERVKIRTEALSLSEETLKKREEQLRLIINAMPAYISYVGKNMTYQEVNKAYEKLFNKSREEIIGKPVWEVVGRKAYENVKDHLEKAMAGESVSYETLQDYQVEKFYTKASLIPHKVNDETIGIFTLVQDITKEKNFQLQQEELLLELKQANKEKELALAEVDRQRQRLQNLFLQAPAHLAIMRGPDFVFELANPRYLEVLGVKDPIEGKTLSEVIPDLDQASRDILMQVYTRGERFVGKELPIKIDWKKNGMPYTRNFTVVYEPIKGVSGKTEGVISFGYEVSDQIVAREQLARLNKKLEKLNIELQTKNEDLLRTNTDLDNFVYTASHDLKSPVANLEGLMKLLNDSLASQADEKQAKLLQMADTSVQKLKQIIKDLVEITKVQKDLEETAEEKVLLKEVVEDVKAGIADLIAESGVKIKEDFKLSEIIYKRSNLRSILYNLLSNAIKYRSPNVQAEVEIRAWKEGKQMVLSVKDNGLGMTPQQQKKLFTMFKRMHTHIEGTGIGLYTVKRIIENNGGHVEVNSEKGKGSEFIVYFNSKESRLKSQWSDFLPSSC